MTTDTALWMILIITLVTAAVGVPISLALREKIHAATAEVQGYKGILFLLFLLSWVTLGLWWYYALRTDQIMLAVIPTVSIVWGWVLRGLMRLTAGTG